MPKVIEVIEVIHGNSYQEIALQLRAAIYRAESNVHNLAMWADVHEGNLGAQLNGKVDMRISSLIDLQTMVNKFLSQLSDDGA